MRRPRKEERDCKAAWPARVVRTGSSRIRQVSHFVFYCGFQFSFRRRPHRRCSLMELKRLIKVCHPFCTLVSRQTGPQTCSVDSVCTVGAGPWQWRAFFRRRRSVSPATPTRQVQLSRLVKHSRFVCHLHAVEHWWHRKIVFSWARPKHTLVAVYAPHCERHRTQARCSATKQSDHGVSRSRYLVAMQQRSYCECWSPTILAGEYAGGAGQRRDDGHREDAPTQCAGVRTH